MNVDFTPLFRTAIGFDRMASLLDQVARTEQGNLSYPPYNIEVEGDDKYKITLALAGFNKDDIEILTEPNLLTIRGKVREVKEEKNRQFLHRGIATRAFERKFQLADHVRVVGAHMDNGLLTIELVKEIPEAMKPRRIEIGSQSLLESSAEAAESAEVRETSAHKVA